MQLIEAIELFLSSKSAAGLSARTVDWYRWQLMAFVHWLEAQGVNGNSWLRVEVVERFLNEEGQRLSASSVAARYRALQTWFRWTVERKLIAVGDNPMVLIKRRREPKTKPRQAGDPEIERLLASIPLGSWIDLRDRLAVQVLRYCGLRAAELCALRVEDVDVAEGIITVRSGKGGDARPVPMMPAVAREYGRYMMLRPEWAGGELMVSADGGSHGVGGVLSVSGLRQMLRRRCAAADVRYLNPHSFRHGLAIRLLNAGADMSLVQDVLGHSRIQTTQERYAKWQIQGLRTQYRKAMGGGTDLDGA